MSKMPLQIEEKALLQRLPEHVVSAGFRPQFEATHNRNRLWYVFVD
jgi:hypothetical protein